MSHACDGCRNGKDLDFEFSMAFQPIVDVARERIWGYEALVRGADGASAGSVLSRIDDENRYRFDQACRVKAIETAAELFPSGEDIKLSINFMPNAVYEPAACLRTSVAAAERVGLARDHVIFEFTEQERIEDVGHVEGIVAEYRRQGFLTAIDDFGAGYAGLTLLAKFQPDIVKLDMDLVRDIDSSHARQTIITAATWMARSLGLTVLAEGIESEGELRVLRAAGIELFQGYYFAKPAFEALPEVSLGTLPELTARSA